MKSYLRLSVAAIALTLFFSAFSVIETKAQGGPLNEILKRMDAHNKALSSLQADVKLVKYNPQIDQTDTQEGVTKYAPQKGRAALVRIDWMKPVVESLAVVKGEYVIFRPRAGQYITGKVSDAKSGGKSANNALAFINMSKTELKANYNIKYLGEENVSGGTPTWHLELTPKNATDYKTADLWVDGNGMPIQAKVTERNNDTTTIFLSNLKKNEKLKASDFAINTGKAKRVQA